MFANVVLLLLYLGHQSQTSAFWLLTAKWAAVLAVLFPVIFFLGMLTRTLFASRELISLSDKTQTVLGKPLLFPVKFKHIRFSPAKDRFNNRFLVVGVPVGLRCRIGNLLAIDDKSLDVTPPPGVVGFSWTRLFSHWSCWFTFDSARFLHRGDHGVDLREKLDNFLISQNEDPSQWPYAYLLGIPQFMGWSRSVVSWWYLYNEERELDALILEINNSYWEKRNVFLRIKPTSDKPNPYYQSSERAEYLDHRNLVRSVPTATKVKFYGGEWHKYIFASPFEKVDGVVSQRMMDPLSPCAWASDATFSNMTTLEETGEVRMATRLTCDGPPIDPTQMSCLDVAKLVLKWTMPVMLTTPEIFWKAIKIRFTGLMKMNSKPPVRSGSVGRHITRLEINLEPIFRAYLAHCVETYPEPVELRYLPCRSFTNDIICMRSPSFNGAENASVRCLTVEPADPAFYTRIISYPDVRIALAQETGHTGHDADPTAQPLIVSDITLLSSILEQKSLSAKEAQGSSTFPSRKLQLLFFLARPKSGPSFMDHFAMSSLEPSSRAAYLSSSLKLSIANALAFGFESLLAVYLFVAFCLTRWLALEVFSLGREYILSLTALNYPAWATVASTIVEYCLVLGFLSAIQKWVML